MLKSDFIELQFNERPYTLSNIAASYAKVRAPKDTIFKYLYLSINHFPHDRCKSWFNNHDREWKSTIKNIYSKVDPLGWKYVENICDSILHSYNKKLQVLLKVMQDRDQGIRDKLDNFYGNSQYSSKESNIILLQNEQNYNDSINQIILDSVIITNGYPGKSLVGLELNCVAASVILHSNNLKYMEKYWNTILNAYANHEIDRSCIPNIEDRILMLKGRKQKYGTQFVYNKATNKMELYPVVDIKEADKLRKLYWLPTLKSDIEFYKKYEEKPK